jgi:hypothetical protein
VSRRPNKVPKHLRDRVINRRKGEVDAPPLFFRLFVPHQLVGTNEILSAMNKSRHVYNGLKKQQEGLVSNSLIGKHRVKTPVNATLTWKVYWKDRHDPINLYGAQKFIFDALVSRGVLPDDDKRGVLNLNHVYEEVREKKEAGVDILLETIF